MNETIYAISSDLENLLIKLEKATALLDHVYESFFPYSIETEGMRIICPDEDNASRVGCLYSR